MTLVEILRISYAIGAVGTAIMFWREMSPWARVGVQMGNVFAYGKLIVMTIIGAAIWPITLSVMLRGKN